MFYLLNHKNKIVPDSLVTIPPDGYRVWGYIKTTVLDARTSVS